MPINPPITDRQRQILAHAIGRDHRMKGRNRQKPWDYDGFRNRFCMNTNGHEEMLITDLISRGLMERGETINGGKAWMAYATEAGVNEVIPPVKRKKVST